ncbi:MAG TPA: DNA-deoxyinosine glycosylase, partial [Methylophilus sp.]
YGFDAALPYTQRVERLMAAKVAVWDVLRSCVRTGSLDSAIEPGSRVVNDFGLFFLQHPHIKLVALNGAEAEKSFKTLVLPTLKCNASFNLNEIRLVRLPSTSPAHTLSLKYKTSAWREALTCT